VDTLYTVGIQRTVRIKQLQEFLKSDHWCGYLSGARCKWFAYGPADATATLSSSAVLKSMMVLPFWYWLTQVVLEKSPLNGWCYCNTSGMFTLFCGALHFSRCPSHFWLGDMEGMQSVKIMATCWTGEITLLWCDAVVVVNIIYLFKFIIVIITSMHSKFFRFCLADRKEIWSVETFSIFQRIAGIVASTISTFNQSINHACLPVMAVTSLHHYIYGWQCASTDLRCVGLSCLRVGPATCFPQAWGGHCRLRSGG